MSKKTVVITKYDDENNVKIETVKESTTLGTMVKGTAIIGGLLFLLGACCGDDDEE